MYCKIQKEQDQDISAIIGGGGGGGGIHGETFETFSRFFEDRHNNPIGP